MVKSNLSRIKKSTEEEFNKITKKNSIFRNGELNKLFAAEK